MNYKIRIMKTGKPETAASQVPKLSLSVIIPCYNEEANLSRGVLEKVTAYLKSQPYPAEVIVVDDGSTDQSLALVEKIVSRKPKILRLIKGPHRGKPAALKTGVEASQNEIALFTDMDQSTPIEEIEDLLPYFSQGYDLVIGSRGKERENFPWYRKLLSWGFRSGRQLFILRDIADTQCGFKAVKAAVARRLFSRLLTIDPASAQTRGWRVTAYDVEFLFLAQKGGYRIAEVPVRWRDEDITNQSGNQASKERNFIKESVEMASEVMSVAINNCRGRYEDL